jgi:hypothetical protein
LGVLRSRPWDAEYDKESRRSRLLPSLLRRTSVTASLAFN